MLASESGMSRVIPLLLERGADIDAVDNAGNTALHIAVSKGELKVVTDLIDEGADTAIKNSKGLTAKELALESGNSRILNAFPNEFQYERRPLEGDYGMAPAPLGSDKLKQALEDPNEVRDRLATDPKLVSQMDVLFKALEEEETKWTSRKQRIKNTFFNAVRKEIDSEILFIQNIAKQEDANNVVQSLDVLQSTWKSIFAKSSRAMREAARGGMGLAVQEMSRSSRSRSRRGQVTDTMASRRGIRGRDGEIVEEVDPHEAYITSWGTIEDGNLDQIYEATQVKIVDDMGSIRLLAEQSNKNRIVNAIDGVMLERKFRGERSLVVYNLNKQELQDAANAMTMDEAARGRRSRRGTTQQTQQTGRSRRR
jgi:hypothetical protein